MKKIIISSLASLFLITTTATAELGLNIGVSVEAGLYGATGKEVNANSTNGTEIAAIGYESFFIEKTLGDYITIGVAYNPSPFSTDTAETAKNDMEPDAQVQTSVENKVQVDFEELTTLYVALNVTENAYVRLGTVSVDVITNEKLGTGSSYGNTSLDGVEMGVGYNKGLNNGFFIRAEGNYVEFDGVSLKSADNTIHLDSLDGVTGKLSVGKSF